MKIFKYLLVMVTMGGILSYFVIAPSYAGNASTYKITVQSIQLKNSSNEWVTIASPNQELDIAAVGAGAMAASFLNDASIPVGSYKNFKIVVSETMKVSGSDGAHYTKSGGVLTIAGTAASAASTSTWPADPPATVTTLTENVETHTATASEQGEITYTLDLDASDGDNYIEISAKNDLATPITVNVGSTMSMYFDFDTQGTVHYISVGPPPNNDVVYYTPPGEGTAFSITVDGTTTTTTESDMKIDF